MGCYRKGVTGVTAAIMLQAYAQALRVQLQRVTVGVSQVGCHMRCNGGGRRWGCVVDATARAGG